MKPLTKSILKWCLLVALILYSVGICVWAADISHTEVCRSVRINLINPSDNDTIVRQGIAQLMTRFDSQIKGRPLNTIDTRAIERYLGTWANFETVQVSLSSAGVMQIDVTQVMPEVRVFDGQRSYYLNAAGKMIASSPEFFCDVPVICGNFTKEFPARNLLGLNRAIQADPLMRDLVAMIKMDSPHNIILVPRINGHVINIGDTTRLAQKFSKLRTMYQKVIPYRGWNTYDTISVKFRGQIVATKANKSRPVHSGVDDNETDMEEASLQAAGLDDATPAPVTAQTASAPSATSTTNQPAKPEKSVTP